MEKCQKYFDDIETICVVDRLFSADQEVDKEMLVCKAAITTAK